MKQATFAELLGVAQATVSRWESGVQAPIDAEQRRILAEFPELRIEPRIEMVFFVQGSVQNMALFDEALEPLAVSASHLALHGYEAPGPSLIEAKEKSAQLVNLLDCVSKAGGFFGGAFAEVLHTACVPSKADRNRECYCHRSRFYPLALPPSRPVLLMESIEITEREFALTGEIIDLILHDGKRKRVFPGLEQAESRHRRMS